jgi:hypothetical protein
VFNSPFALFSHLFADRLRGPLSVNDARPAVISAVKFGRAGLADTIRSAASALGR